MLSVAHVTERGLQSQRGHVTRVGIGTRIFELGITWPNDVLDSAH
jgi:hypothetical protein